MKTRITRSISLTFLLFLVLEVFSQIPYPNRGEYFNWSGAWQYGTSEAIAVDSVRSYAYLASGGAVLTLDVSDPMNPVMLNKSIRTTGQVLDIHVDYDNMNLLLACDEAGLEIWDVDDVNNPYRISTIEIIYGGVDTPVRHVEKYGDFAVTENNWGYVHTVNISDPANPFQVAFNGVMGNPAHDISVSSNGYIHATGQQYTVLLKINPDGSLNLLSNYYQNASSIFGTQDASFISNNGYLYIIDYSGGGTSSTPASFHDILVKDDMAYMIGSSSFMIFDVSDLENPVSVGQATVSASTSQLDIAGDYAYISCGYEGMRVVDFSIPSSPAEVGMFEGTGVTWSSEIVDDYAFLANSLTGVSIIDISDPAGSGPEKVAEIASNQETRALAIENNTLYFADWTGGLRIYSVEDPKDPTPMGSIENVNAWRVQVNNSVLFLDNANANNPDTLQIYDVSDPESPVMLTSMLLPELIWEIMFYEDYLYVCTQDEGLLVIDVRDPENPEQVAFVDLPDVSDIDIEADIAYVASTDWDGGLVTIDISDPEDPQIINIYNPSGWYHPFHVAVSGDFAYTGENFGEVKMFDITDPSNPQELDAYVTSGSIVHMNAMGNYLYSSDGPTGLQIFYTDLTTGTEEISTDKEIQAQVFPNPFRESTSISFDLETEQKVSCKIFDLSGKEVSELFDGMMTRGTHVIRWDGSSGSGSPLPQGFYFYSLSGEGVSQTGKIILQR